MIEITGDLFEQECDAICITTNGYVSASGHNTMGGGCAGEAKKKWPGIDKVLGQLIRARGNNVYLLTTSDKEYIPHLRTHDGTYSPRNHLVSFPTKHGKITDWDDLLPRYRGQYSEHLPVDAPGWMGQSDLELIIESALQLRALTIAYGWTKVCMPRAGAGLGGLRWEDVRGRLAPILDDRFQIITFGR